MDVCPESILYFFSLYFTLQFMGQFFGKDFFKLFLKRERDRVKNHDA